MEEWSTSRPGRFTPRDPAPIRLRSRRKRELGALEADDVSACTDNRERAKYMRRSKAGNTV